MRKRWLTLNETTDHAYFWLKINDYWQFLCTFSMLGKSDHWHCYCVLGIIGGSAGSWRSLKWLAGLNETNPATQSSKEQEE